MATQQELFFKSIQENDITTLQSLLRTGFKPEKVQSVFLNIFFLAPADYRSLRTAIYDIKFTPTMMLFAKNESMPIKDDLVKLLDNAYFNRDLTYLADFVKFTGTHLLLDKIDSAYVNIKDSAPANQNAPAGS